MCAVPHRWVTTTKKKKMATKTAATPTTTTTINNRKKIVARTVTWEITDKKKQQKNKKPERDWLTLSAVFIAGSLAHWVWMLFCRYRLCKAETLSTFYLWSPPSPNPLFSSDILYPSQDCTTLVPNMLPVISEDIQQNKCMIVCNFAKRSTDFKL